jgi:phosphoglucosamine mutase
MAHLFGTDGIRGRAGRGVLAPAFVGRVARTVGSMLRREPAMFHAPVPAGFRHLRAPDGVDAQRSLVLIGRDTRASGPGLERALARGFRAAGLEVGLAGVLTTPGVALLTRDWGCALGVVISASHNPASDNGIKFISPQGFKIPDAAEAAIEARLERAAPASAADGRGTEMLHAGAHYLDFLSGFCRPLRGMKIVVDCGHGAASALAGPLLARLGARATVLHASPDGRNINAGCGALHPEKVAAAVRRAKADVGAAFDGDADRAILVDEKGAIRDGDHILALAAGHLREKKALRKSLVVSTVMANYGLEVFLAKKSIALRRTKVGDRYVAEEMLRSGAVLGGEQSGHVLFFDAAPAGDGMLTMLRVLDILAERGERLSRLAGAMKKFPQRLINVPVARKTPLDDVAGIRAASAAAERALGRDGRLLVRYSGTEPICRVMVEGPRQALVDRVARSVADAVRKELS